MPVSKTDFMRGLQCEKMLWLDAHAPQYKIIPPEIQAKLDAGNDFGDKAMGIFGAYVETTAYKEDGRLDFAKMLAKTQECIAQKENVILMLKLGHLMEKWQNRKQLIDLLIVSKK